MKEKISITFKIEDLISCIGNRSKMKGNHIRRSVFDGGRRLRRTFSFEVTYQDIKAIETHLFCRLYGHVVLFFEELREIKMGRQKNERESTPD
jgi:hypothetical protein